LLDTIKAVQMVQNWANVEREQREAAKDGPLSAGSSGVQRSGERYTRGGSRRVSEALPNAVADHIQIDILLREFEKNGSEIIARRDTGNVVRSDTKNNAPRARVDISIYNTNNKTLVYLESNTKINPKPYTELDSNVSYNIVETHYENCSARDEQEINPYFQRHVENPLDSCSPQPSIETGSLDSRHAENPKDSGQDCLASGFEISRIRSLLYHRFALGRDLAGFRTKRRGLKGSARDYRQTSRFEDAVALFIRYVAKQFEPGCQES